MTPNLYFLLASLLFSIGLMGIVSRRNLFVIYLSIELMLTSVSLLLGIFSNVLGESSGAVMALLMMAVIAAEAALFLAMIIHLYRHNQTLDSGQYNSLKQEQHSC